MANLRMLLAFGIGLLVFAETAQAAPKRSRSKQPNITVIQLPAAAPCGCNTGSAGCATVAGPTVITINGGNGVTVANGEKISAGNVTAAAPVVVNEVNNSASVTTVQEITNVTVATATVPAPTITADEISGGGVAASVEDISDDGRIGRGKNSPVYERLRKAVLAWQAVPENFALCGKEDPDNTVHQLLEDMHSSSVADKSKRDKVKASSMVGWNVAILTATGRHCVGTLVSNRHIAFAASCMLDETHAANLTVLFNVLFNNDEFESYVKSNNWNVFRVKAVAQHPLHNPDVLQQDNVALLELQKDAPLGVANIRPACILPKSVLGSNYTQAEHCLMTSYEQSQTEPKATPPSLIFHSGEKFKPLEFCEQTFPKFQPERQVCAEGYKGFINRETIACPGLVGAGLLCQVQMDKGSRTEERKWYLVGVASYSESSCDGLTVFQDMWTGFAADNSTAHL